MFARIQELVLDLIALQYNPASYETVISSRKLLQKIKAEAHGLRKQVVVAHKEYKRQRKEQQQNQIIQ